MRSVKLRESIFIYSNVLDYIVINMLVRVSACFMDGRVCVCTREMLAQTEIYKFIIVLHNTVELYFIWQLPNRIIYWLIRVFHKFSSVVLRQVSNPINKTNIIIVLLAVDLHISSIFFAWYFCPQNKQNIITPTFRYWRRRCI